MAIPDVNLSPEQIVAFRWHEIMASCPERECDEYSRAFFARAEESEAAGDDAANTFLALLGAVTSFRLDIQDPSQPFKPFFVAQTFRTAAPEDLNDGHFGILGLIADDVADPELRARIGDLIWTCRRDYRRAVLAVDAYLESAAFLEDPEHWPPCIQRIERAIQVAASLGRNQPHRERVLTHIEAMLQRYDGEDPLFLSARLMELLLEQRHGDPARYAPLAEKAALRAEQQSQ